MLLITCPHCGPRAGAEFTFERPAESIVRLDATPEAAAERLFYARKSPGPVLGAVAARLWMPRLAAGGARHGHPRDRRDGALERRGDERAALAGRGPDRPRTPGPLQRRRPQLYRVRRRHPGVGPAGVGRAGDGAQLQVSSAARRAGRRRGGAERPVRRRAGRPARAEHTRHRSLHLRGAVRLEPEPLAEPRLRSGRGEPVARALHPGGLLLQDLLRRPAAVEGLRAVHPRRCGPRARAAGAGGGRLRASRGVLRRAGGRRRPVRTGGGRCGGAGGRPGDAGGAGRTTGRRPAARSGVGRRLDARGLRRAGAPAGARRRRARAHPHDRRRLLGPWPGHPGPAPVRAGRGAGGRARPRPAAVAGAGEAGGSCDRRDRAADAVRRQRSSGRDAEHGRARLSCAAMR